MYLLPSCLLTTAIYIVNEGTYKPKCIVIYYLFIIATIVTSPKRAFSV